MKRREINRILSRHPGSKAEVSRRAGVKSQTVSMWIKHGSNANVAAYAEQHARELLAQEEADRLAKGVANGPSVRAVLPILRKQSQSEGEC